MKGLLGHSEGPRWGPLETVDKGWNGCVPAQSPGGRWLWLAARSLGPQELQKAKGKLRPGHPVQLWQHREFPASSLGLLLSAAVGRM